MLDSSHKKFLRNQWQLVMFCLSAFSLAFLYSQTTPLFSLYLTKVYNASNTDLGIFYLILSLTTILITQSAGKRSDAKGHRRAYILTGALAGSLATFLYSIETSFLTVFSISIFIFSFLYMSAPQLMALARESFDDELNAAKIPFFNSILRSCFALAWIVGPPCGFYIVDKYGFSILYGYLSFLYLFLFTFLYLFIPKNIKILVPAQKIDGDTSEHIEAKIWLAFFSFCILYAVNHAYIVSLPLFIERVLGESTVHAGNLMALAASIEIPVFLLAGILVRRVSILLILGAGVLCACLFYGALLIADSIVDLYILQILNGLFIGLISGLGLTWFQDQKSSQIGRLSSLYSITMSVGYILGGLIIIAASLFVSFRSLYFLNLIFSILALALLFILFRFFNVVHRKRLSLNQV